MLQGPPRVPLGGSGVYTEGTVMAIKAPNLFGAETDGERLMFVAWENVGQAIPVIPNPEKPTTIITVDAPYTLEAKYKKQFLVVAATPSGTVLRQWVDDGEEMSLEIAPILETIPGLERMVFKRWDGQEALTSPNISGAVVNPLRLRAVYERQVKISVEAPHGSAGEGWYPIGSTATVTVPEQVSNRYLFKNQFVRFAGYGPGQATVQILAQEPTTISAVYQTRIDLLVLGLLIVGIAIGLPVQLGLIYIVGRWLFSLKRRRSEPAPSYRRSLGSRSRSDT